MNKQILMAATPLLCLSSVIAEPISKLITRKYWIRDAKIKTDVNLVILSDLHSCKFGANQSVLLDAIKKEKPDIIMLIGDMFDTRLPMWNTGMLFQEIVKICPVYFVTGNHEYKAGHMYYLKYMAMLSHFGINLLSDEFTHIKVGNSRLFIAGINDPYMASAMRREDEWGNGLITDSEYFTKLETFIKNAEDDEYTILMAHRPEFFDDYCWCGYDLVAAGHTHGGQWRIPGLVNGIWSPGQGFLPRLAGGRYEHEKTTMIVNRGLASGHPPIPRLFNTPEIVSIKLRPLAANTIKER